MSNVIFRPWGDAEWLFTKHKSENWAAIACCATETRSVDSILALSRVVKWMSVVSIWDPDPADDDEQNKVLAAASRRLSKDIKCPYAAHQADLKASLDTVRDLVDEAVAKSSDIILDITSFPKRWFFPMVRFLCDDERVANLIVVYTLGDGYADQISENYEVLRPIQGFPSVEGRTEHDLAFVGVGFHSSNMLAMFGDDHPRALRLLFPFPPGPPGLKRNWRFVQHVDRALRFDEELQVWRPMEHLQLSALDVSQAFDALRILSDKGTRTSLMAPYGPKPISLAMCLFAVMAEQSGLPEVPVYYSQPQRYHLKYTSAAKMRSGRLETLAYSIKHNGQTSYKI
ncbi:hypothetical protein [Rhizobium sp. YK2]|uniref:hypothetical protein n=1 Tax=Rhizobium sp. YK2 TaxID=1860096 RepID=UPI00084BC99B|nr:hypothetical protein [Rhizobium sp. YK2]OED00953.1 hypothetical protein A9Z06_13530 [Rhizobium sp. YK2]